MSEFNLGRRRIMQIAGARLGINSPAPAICMIRRRPRLNSLMVTP
ncbi:hypothetical protein [Pseudomonas protegens]|nr:hypothetical protein [Pseudomonas protegens]